MSRSEFHDPRLPDSAPVQDHTSLLHPIWWQAANVAISQIKETGSFSNGVNISRDSETGSLTVSVPDRSHAPMLDFVMEITQKHPGQEINAGISDASGVDSGLSFSADMHGRNEISGVPIIPAKDVTKALFKAVLTSKFGKKSKPYQGY